MPGIKAMKQSLLSEFEIRGYWNIPDSINSVPGTLIYSRDSIYLELFGSLEEDGDSFNFDVKSPEVIWGISEKGEEFTLFSLFRTNISANFSGFFVESYNVSHFLVGEHIYKVEENKFYSMNIELTYLATWLGMQALQSELSFQSENFIGHTLKTVSPEEFKIEVHALNAILENSGRFSLHNDKYNKAEVVFNSSLKLTPNEMQNFKWYSEKLYSIQKLMTLLTGQSIYVENVGFKGERNIKDLFGEQVEEVKEYKWFYNQRNIKMKEKVRFDDFTVSYQEIKDIFPIIVNKWFEKEVGLDVVYDLFINEFYKITNVTSTFLNFIQAIEVYHRRSYDGKIIEENDYDLFKNEMREFIENKAPKELKEKFIKSLDHGNERTLSYRLKELIRNLLPETKLFLFNSENNVPKEFLKQLVDTRNYLTHYDPENKDIIEPEKRFYAIQRLKALVTILLFKEIGMQEDVILRKLKKNQSLRFFLNEANQELKY